MATLNHGDLMVNATEITSGHYQRPEVKEIILKSCNYNGGFRGLNGDDGWYTKERNGEVKLRGPLDYDDTTSRARSLYMTADVFTPSVFSESSRWVKGRGGEGKPEFPIGTRRDLISYTLFADIDAVKDPNGPDGSKLYHDGRIDALESAATFVVNYLKGRGISESVAVLFSGQGLYVWLHPGLSDMSSERGLEDFDPEKLDYDFKVWMEAFNALLYDIESAFFKEFPDCKGEIKFDKLNNQKRKIKCVLSIHKSLPFAVVPLNKNDIRIDLNAARITLDDGLPDETIRAAGEWLDAWSSSGEERSALVKLLKPYAIKAAKDISRKVENSGDIEVSSEAVSTDDWCPFYRSLLSFPGGEGAHRVCGALATWLYQAGWNETEAFDLWYPVAARCDVETRIFYTSYGVICSPSCKTIQKTSAGYPSLGFGGLNLCNPDDKCDNVKWPMQYGKQPEHIDENMTDFCILVTNKNGQYYKFSPSKAADAIMGKYFILAMAKKEPEIFWYDGQIYQNDGDRKIDLEICEIVKDKVGGRDVQEVTRRVKNRLLEVPVVFDPDPFLLGLKNGVADLRTGKIREYGPDDLITDMINVEYDPEAKCPMFLEFLESSAPHITDRITLIDWMVACAIKEPLPYVLFLLGLGRNGKGLYERLLMRFFKEESFRDMALMEVTKNNFAASEFHNKRGWIAAEQSGKKKSTIGTDFMKLTSGNGIIDSDRKNKSRIQYRPYFQTIVDTNAMPKIEDTSIGWMERFIKVDLPFNFVFNPDSENPMDRQRDPHLFDKMATDEELSGILNILLWRAVEISKTMSIHKRPSEEMFNEYVIQSSSVSTFCEKFCQFEEDVFSKRIPTRDIYKIYKQWCSALVGEVVDEAYFGRYLKRFCNGKTPYRGKDENGKNYTAYTGLLFDDKAAIADTKAMVSGFSSSLKYSEVDLKKNIPKKGHSIAFSDVSEVELWNSILKRFGSISLDSGMVSPYREEYSKNGDLLQIPQKTATRDAENGSDASDLPPFASDFHENIDKVPIDQLLSELERKEEITKPTNLAEEYHIPEKDVCEMMDDRGWTETLRGGMWSPPSRSR